MSYGNGKMCFSCIGVGVRNCPSCNGWGKIRTVSHGYDPTTYTTREIEFIDKCLKCKGSGKIQCIPCLSLIHI